MKPQQDSIPDINHSPVLAEIDAALRDDAKHRQMQRKGFSATPELEKGSSMLPKLLRVFGALVLVAATTIFLLQGWQEASYLMRYYSFLLFTAVLTGAGFVCGLKVKEDKGARTFLAIAVGIVPAHFAQLGAFMYSGSGLPVDPSRYPGFALWVAPDLYTAMHTTGIALVFLLPIVYLGFTALLRRSAPKLTMVYAVIGAALLIPTRDPLIVGLLGIVQSVGLALFDYSLRKNSSQSNTMEGRIARSMLWTPVVILFIRNVMLYQFDITLIGCIAIAVSVMMFFLLGRSGSTEDGALHQVLAQIPAGFGWTLIALQLAHDYRFDDTLVIPFVVLPIATLFMLMAEYARDYGRLFRGSAVSVATAGMALSLLSAASLFSAFIALLVGMSSVVYGFAVEKRYHVLAGALTTVAALTYYILEAIERFSMSPWMSLALLGVSVIFLASYIERNYDRIRERYFELRESIKKLG